MKTEKRKQYETPSVEVVETNLVGAVLLTGSSTLDAPEGEEEPQLEDGTWGGLDETLGGI